MTEQQQAAMRQALEALSASDDFLFNYHDCEPNNEREVDAYSEVRGNNMKAWEAIREALAEQPAQQQEPVAFEIRAFNTTQALIKRADVAQEKADVLERGFGCEADVTIVPLYTSPQPSKPWVGLTDEQIQAIAFEAVKDNWDWLKFARAIETKLREKNTGEAK